MDGQKLQPKVDLQGKKCTKRANKYCTKIALKGKKVPTECTQGIQKVYKRYTKVFNKFTKSLEHLGHT